MPSGDMTRLVIMVVVLTGVVIVLIGQRLLVKGQQKVLSHLTDLAESNKRKIDLLLAIRVTGKRTDRAVHQDIRKMLADARAEAEAKAVAEMTGKLVDLGTVSPGDVGEFTEKIFQAVDETTVLPVESPEGGGGRP